MRDALLLPPALLYVVVENVFWAGAKRLLREVSRVAFVEKIHSGVKRLPPSAVLPLFLIPEVLSHVGGFWASALLVQRHWFGAFLVGLFIKGGATLAEVWIYQSCERTLLSVRWFAWLHGQMMRGRDWVYQKTRPARALARRLVAGGRSGQGRRFAALRGLLARRLGMARK